MMKRKLLHDSDDDDGGVEDSPAFKEKEVTWFKIVKKCQLTHSFSGKLVLKLSQHCGTCVHQPQVCCANVYSIPQEELWPKNCLCLTSKHVTDLFLNGFFTGNSN
jgi:hypothetical protein